MKGTVQQAPDRRAVARSLVWLAPVLIVAGAAALRLWAIDFGLPNTATRPDEREALQYTTGFPSGDLNPRWFIYPNLYFYVVWLWEELLLAARRVVLATPPYAVMLREDVPTLILYGRVLSVAVGTATVAAVYAIGRALGGRSLGLLGAVLLACNFLHIRDSRALKPDVFLALGVLVSLWALAGYVRRPDRRQALVSGCLIGLTTAFKYPGILLMAAAHFAGVLVSPQVGLRRLLPSVHILLIGVVGALIFLVTCPYLILDFERTRDTGSFATRAVYATRPHAVSGADAGAIERAAAFIRARAFGYHLGVSLRRGCGFALALATPLALLLALRQPGQPMLFLAAVFSVFYYLVIGASPVHLARYLTPITPILTLLVAHLVCTAVARAPRPAMRTAATAVLTLTLIAEPLASAFAHNRIAARTDTRVQATRWMEEHLPAGSVAALLGSSFFPIADPELPKKVRRAPLRLGETDFDRHRVTHVVTHEHPLPFSNRDPVQMRTLGPHLRLLAEFDPFTDGPAGTYELEDAYYIPFFHFHGVERPGPLVRIYAYEARP